MVTVLASAVMTAALAAAPCSDLQTISISQTTIESATLVPAGPFVPAAGRGGPGGLAARGGAGGISGTDPDSLRRQHVGDPEGFPAQGIGVCPQNTV